MRQFEPKPMGRPKSPFLSKPVKLHFENEDEYRRLLEQVPDLRKRVKLIMYQADGEDIRLLKDMRDKLREGNYDFVFELIDAWLEELEEVHS